MSQHLSGYYDKKWIGERARSGKHRDLVGGLWDEMSKLQLDLLIQHGMTETSRLLDIGCGSLRLGHAAAAFLAPGNYWGTDLSADLIDAGYENEIVPNGLADRLPRSNLVEDAEFTFEGVPSQFDFIMAQSVFTHLPLNHLRMCLARLANHLEGPAQFLFTIFMPAPGIAAWQSSPQAEGLFSHPHRDPYHYDHDDILHAARGLPWSIEVIGDWSHPRNAQLIKATLR